MVRTMRYMVEPAPAEKSVYDCHISAEARTEARRLMDFVLKIASGQKVCAERHGFHDLAIFKTGVTL